MNKEQTKKCRLIADTYGKSNQEGQTVSELMELGHVLTRRMDQRESDWKDKLLDEMADVTVMIKQLQLLYDISDGDLNDRIDYKLDRQIYRIKGGDCHGKEE